MNTKEELFTSNLLLAQQGNNDAQYNLGEMYQDGRGVQQNGLKAFEWYEKAAQQGHAEAQYNLGEMYQDGLDIQQNDLKAFEWYEKAAQQGHTDAQFTLSLMYEKGDGVTQDDQKAKEWWEKATQQGDDKAQENLRAIPQNNESVPNKRQQEDTESLFNLALNYYNGHGGVSQDYQKAKELFEKAAKQGNAKAQTSLGNMYRNGQGVSQDYQKAKELFEKAAKQGDEKAQEFLGDMYFYGESVLKDYQKAKEWYEKAKKQNKYHAGSTKLSIIESKDVNQNSIFDVLAPFIPFILIAIGFAQVMAITKGFHYLLGWNVIAIAIISIIAMIFIPTIGAILGVIGAVYGWGWEWWEAILLFMWPAIFSLLGISISDLID